MHNKALNRKRWHGAAGAAVLASAAMMGGTFALTSGAASADPTSGSTPVTTIPADAANLSGLQARAARAITNRVNSLEAAIKNIEADTWLGSDGTTLVNNMSNDITGLQTLGNEIAGQTNYQDALSEFRQIFRDFRIYLLVLPDASLVVQVDRQAEVVLPAVQKDVTTLLGEVTSTTPKYVVRWINQAQNLVTKATTATNGLSSQLLSYTAADWNANHRVLATARGGTRSAQLDSIRARYDVARADFYFNHHHGTATTTSTSTTTTTVG
jgi:hypothetical protein